MRDGGTIARGTDIELAGYVDIFKDTIIDLNGHVLSALSGTYSIALMSRQNNNVIIRDSVGGGMFGSERSVNLMNDGTGTMIVESGHIECIHHSSGTLTLSEWICRLAETP